MKRSGDIFLSEGKKCIQALRQEEAKDLKEAKMTVAETMKGNSEGRNQ